MIALNISDANAEDDIGVLKIDSIPVNQPWRNLMP